MIVQSATGASSREGNAEQIVSNSRRKRSSEWMEDAYLTVSTLRNELLMLLKSCDSVSWDLNEICTISSISLVPFLGGSLWFAMDFDLHPVKCTEAE